MTKLQPALVLASASPRRRELLRYLTPSFHVIATDAEETDFSQPPDVVAALPPVDLPLAEHPTLLAWRKANAACREAPESVIIGADTIVVLDGAMIGKPRDPAHARMLLRQLAGRTHIVYTGLAIIDCQPRAEARQVRYDLVASDVTIMDLTDDDIDRYVATGEPLDKAGAYGIQGLGGRLVRDVVGSYTNVVGLPIPAVHRLLAASVNVLCDPFEAYLRWLGDQGKEPLPCPPTLP